MMPFSSVAIIEKLALVRIAFCKAPVLSNASWRRTSVVLSALPASSRRVGFPVLDMVDFREKRRTIWMGAALVGADQKIAASAVGKENLIFSEGKANHHSLVDRRLYAVTHKPIDEARTRPSRRACGIEQALKRFKPSMRPVSLTDARARDSNSNATSSARVSRPVCICLRS